MAQKIDKANLGKPKDVVSQDRNWVLRINNEMASQKTWDNQWGFLSGGFSPELVNAKPSIDDKIKQLQQQINQLGTKDIYSRTNGDYGQGNNVQIFQTNKYNIKQGKDLRALQRRLPKNWKKQKWTPPVDQFDPLANMYKKKK